jgi:flagellin-like protein
MDFKIKKKGISPLFATILLLALAVGLGVLVMNWGRASLEESARCSVDLELKVIELDNQPQICIGGSGEQGYISFIVENGPIVDISELQFRAIGTKSIYMTDLPESEIPRGYPLEKTLPYNFDLFGEPKQFKLTPKIELFPGEKISCPEQALIVENIRRC